MERVSSRASVIDRLGDPARPPLQHGDRLSREEFERRWDLHPEIRKAELIDGQVFLDMTVSRAHGRPHGDLSDWLGAYARSRRGVERLTETTVRFADGTDVQPDLQLRLTEGGSSRVSEDDCVEGPPELVAEIAVSSASYDLHAKKEVYRRNGVSEYLVWQLYENRLDWWTLRDGEYAPITPGPGGVIESRQFPGLRLEVPALLAGDIARVMDTP